MEVQVERSAAHGGDGNGWVVSADGMRRWGRFGAAGLLLRAPDPSDPGTPLVLLQHRAVWTASGDTWALTGGARDSHETEAEAALRETEEEAGIDPDLVRVRATAVTSRMTGTAWHRSGGVDLSAMLARLRPEQGRDELRALDEAEPPALERLSDDDVEWTYTTVVADTAEPLDTVANNESLELRWVPERQVARMPLMPAFAEAWEHLRTIPVRLVIDVANVLGSRPDGWWRDRLGATERLLDRLAADLPRTLALPDGRYGWVGSVDAVVEGAARSADHGGWLSPHRAPGAGDDAIVDVAHGGPAGADVVVVVTADRGLRSRLAPDVVTVGPSAVLSG